MGIKGFSAFAKKHNLFLEELKMIQFKREFNASEILVDLYGSFYNLCVNFAMKNEFKELASCMSTLFEGLNVTFYIDGKRSLEKHATHVQRDLKRTAKLCLLRQTAMDLDPNKKLKTSRWKKIKGLTRNCFRMNIAHRESITTAFEAMELRVVVAEHEADVAIAKFVSNLLIHDVLLAARPWFTNKFDVQSLSFKIIRKLELTKRLIVSHNGLKALGILAGNDYCSNVKGYGIGKVYEFILKTDLLKDKDAISIVQEFSSKTGVQNHFENAVEVFVKLNENECKECFIDATQPEYNECMSIIDDYFEKYKVRKDSKISACHVRFLEELNHLVLPSHKNRFCPLIHSTYGRYKPKHLKEVLNQEEKEVHQENQNVDQKGTSNSTMPQLRDIKKKPKAPKKKKAKTKRDKSGRAVRSIQSEEKRKKPNWSKATLDMGSLKKNFDTKTWKLGTLNASLNDSSLPPEVRPILLARIQQVVEIMNRVSYAAVAITGLYFKQSKSCKNTDDELFFGSAGGFLYWYNLLSFLLRPKTCGMQVPWLFQEVKQFMKNHELKFILPNTDLLYVEYCSFDVIMSQSRLIDQMIALHFIGSAPQLAAKVKEHDPTLMETVDKILNLIRMTTKAKGKTEDNDLLENESTLESSDIDNFQLNTTGPSADTASLSSYLGSAENNFALRDLSNDVGQSRIVGPYSLRGSKRKREGTYDDMLHSGSRVLFKVGVLETYSIVRLFTTLNNMLPKSGQFSSFPTYTPTHSPLHLTEDCLLDIFGKEDSKQYLSNYLVKEGDITHFKLKRECTGMILKHVFGIISKRYRSYSLIGDSDTQKRFVLTTSFITDGFSLLVHVIDRHARKVKHESGPPMAAKDPEFNKSTDIILGLDLGQTYTASAVSWLPDGSKKILAVKKTALGEPGRLHRNWLNKTKMEDQNKTLRDAENIVLGQGAEESDEIYFIRIMERYSTISQFYNSHAVRKRSFEYQCAMQREMDRVFNALISMVGLKPNQKVKGNKRIYVGVGSGDFDSNGSFHTSFLKYFVRKAKPMGLTILGVDEYFTSQKCVRCHDVTESLSMRAKQCPKCNVVFHRDILAADNMCAALSEMLERGERPEYLCKPPDDEIKEATEEPVQNVKKSGIKGRNPKEKDKKDKQEGLRRSSRQQKALENAATKKKADYHGI